MTPLVANLNFILAIGTIGLILGCALLIFDRFTSRSLRTLIAKYGQLVALAAAASSSVMTLIYSEVFGFLPCGLCWFERIFLYPQVFLITTAIYTKDKSYALYGIVLSIPGLIIASYHHFIQMGGSEFIACPSSGGDCSQRILFEFGFVTYPLMAAALFAFLIVLYSYLMFTDKNS